MEDTTRLKIILLGLFLAALALGYLIFSQRTATQEFQARPVAQMETIPSPTTSPAGQAPATQTTVTPTPQTIAQINTQTTKGGQPVTSTLPNTGVPSVLAGIFSALSALAGWKLRRFSFKI